VAAYETSASRKEALASRFGATDNFLGALADDSDRAQFDVILMAEVIEHILDEDLDAVLQRLSGLTKPGGTLVVTTPNNEDLALGMCYDPLGNTLFHRWQHVRSFTAGSLAALFERFGFAELVTHQIGLDNALFVPYDPMWGGASTDVELPSHIVEMRANRSGAFGTQNSLIYIGTRKG
jgi:SAM-dependent methyltransferase